MDISEKTAEAENFENSSIENITKHDVEELSVLELMQVSGAPQIINNAEYRLVELSMTELSQVSGAPEIINRPE